MTTITINGCRYSLAPVAARQVPSISQLMSGARKRSGLTQQQAADAVGVSLSTVFNYECEPKDLLITARLCRLYGIDGNDLIDSLLRDAQ